MARTIDETLEACIKYVHTSEVRHENWSMRASLNRCLDFILYHNDHFEKLNTEKACMFISELNVDGLSSILLWVVPAIGEDFEIQFMAHHPTKSFSGIHNPKDGIMTANSYISFNDPAGMIWK